MELESSTNKWDFDRLDEINESRKEWVCANVHFKFGACCLVMQTHSYFRL